VSRPLPAGKTARSSARVDRDRPIFARFHVVSPRFRARTRVFRRVDDRCRGGVPSAPAAEPPPRGAVLALEHPPHRATPHPHHALPPTHGYAYRIPCSCLGISDLEVARGARAHDVPRIVAGTRSAERVVRVLHDPLATVCTRVCTCTPPLIVRAATPRFARTGVVLRAVPEQDTSAHASPRPGAAPVPRAHALSIRPVRRRGP
jgi:hypothetical protein